MTEQEKEMMLDLLVEKFVYGLSEEDAGKLDALGFDQAEAESIELTVATLGMAGLSYDEEMPSHLHAKLIQAADSVLQVSSGTVTAPVEAAPREIVLTGGNGRSWFGWLGWTAAAAASIALAVSLFIPRGGEPVARSTSGQTASPEVRPDPAKERQEMLAAGGAVIMAEWGKGNHPDSEGISGDIVWSDEKQTGYMRLRGLPVNDKSREQYQLWIFEDAKLEEHPKDGGVFDVNSEGEVIVPIDAKLATRDPKAFAITVEKPGGVVVSSRKKIAGLAAVKPKTA